MVDDGDAVAQGLGLLHVVGGHDHCGAALADGAHHVPHGQARLGVERGGELVEEDQFGLAQQGERDEDPLALSSGELVHVGAPFGGYAELVEQRGGVGGVGVHGREEGQRLVDCDLGRQGGGLQLDADALAPPLGRVGRVLAEHVDIAAVGQAQALKAFHEGRLARAVGADDPEDLALGDLQ